jgi:hypothetical protein
MQSTFKQENPAVTPKREVNDHQSLDDNNGTTTTQHFNFLETSLLDYFPGSQKLPVEEGPQIKCLTYSASPQSSDVHCPRNSSTSLLPYPSSIVRCSNGSLSHTHSHLPCLLVILFIAILCIIQQPPSSRQAAFCW